MNTAASCACMGPPGNCPCLRRGFYQFTPYAPPNVSAWMCPKCNSVYAPTQMECWRCNPPPQYIVTSTAGSATPSQEE